jgi:protein-disulfide isomerase
MSALKIPITSSDHIQGSEDAPIKLVEYGDYECPHCGAAHPIVKAIQEHFGPQLAYVFRHFPLIEIHPNAESAAETAEFAGAHGRFWEMHDLIFANQERLGRPLLFALADALDLPEEDLQDALVSRLYDPKVRTDFLGGVRSGVAGTPTFFINGDRHSGPYEFQHLVSDINAHRHASMLP